MHPTASMLVKLGIAGIAAAMAALFVVEMIFAAQATGRPVNRVALLTSLGVTLWIGAAGYAADSGILLQFDLRPPPVAGLFAATIAMGIILGSSAAGDMLARGLPLWVLVLAQSFRLPLEMVMHAAASEGTMPNAMSFSGYNFDIVTGFLAIPAAIACRIGAPLKWIAAWNWLGFLTLTGIGVVSFLASPVMQAFGPDQVNRWIAYLPFVWLPTVLVVCAIAGHIVIWRRLCMETG